MSIVVVCKCGKRLRADRSHAGKRARCSNCGHVLMLPVLPDVPSPCALDDPEIPYYVIQNGQKQGPFTRAELKSRRLRSDSLVWQSGLTGWQRVDQLIELKALLTELQVSVSNKDKPPPLYDPRAFETLYSWFRVSVVPGTIGCTVLAFVPGVLLVANLVYSLYLIVAVVFYMMLLYKSWKQIQDGAVRTTPGKAVGLLF